MCRRAYSLDGTVNRTSYRDPNSVGEDCTYDELGRKVQCADTQEQAESVHRSFAYDLEGNPVSQTDAKGHTSYASFDARGRKVTTTDRNGGLTIFRYDENSNLLEIIDADANQSGTLKSTLYTYDARNLRISEALPDHNTASTIGTTGYDKKLFAYDAAHRPRINTDQKGDTVTFNYDLAGRLTSRDYRLAINSPSGTIADSDTFTFDKDSRMLSATSGRYANTVATTYDNASRLSSESLTAFGQTYSVSRAYDAANRNSAIGYPDGSLVARNYTSRDQLAEVDYTPFGGSAATIATFTYDPGMRETQRVHGNGIVTNRTYSRADNLPTSLSTPGVTSFAYSYDANKNKTAEADGILTNYGWSTGSTGYDSEDRLTNWARSNGVDSQSWNLSLVGDWNSTSINGTPQICSHNAVHELTQINPTGGPTLSYDLKGNLTVNSTGARYVWDFDNRMSSADTDGDGTADVTFTYDALGRRVSKTSTTGSTVYVSAGQQEVAEYAAGDNPATTAPQRRYIFGDYIDEVLASVTANPATVAPQQTYVYGTYVDEPLAKIDFANGAIYYHTNRQYCVEALTDSTGAVVERYGYAAYGVTTILAPDGTTVRSTSNIGNPYMYTGRRLDPEFAGTSADTIYYYRARHYDPQQGRFIGRDPLEHVDGMSMYQYVTADPYDGLDPSGLVNTKEGCEKSFARLLKTNKKLREINESIKKCTGKDLAVDCRCCKDQQPKSSTAWYDLKSTLVICYDRTDSANSDELTITIVHEAIHAYDDLCRKTNWNDCQQRACSEIRAYNISGGCNKWKKYGYHSYRDCVEQRAWSSTKVDKKCKEEDVKAAMKSCFSDITVSNLDPKMLKQQTRIPNGSTISPCNSCGG